MKKYLAALGASLLPFLALAQSNPQLGGIQQFVADVDAIVDALLPIAVSLAVLFFFWGLATFILAAGDETARDRGKNIMIWGVIALFVIVSVWGIIGFLGNLFGIGQGGSAPVPGVDATQSTGGIPIP